MARPERDQSEQLQHGSWHPYKLTQKQRKHWPGDHWPRFQGKIHPFSTANWDAQTYPKGQKGAGKMRCTAVADLSKRRSGRKSGNREQINLS